MNDKKYGNSNYWCFLPEGYSDLEIAIWKGPEGSETIIGRAVNKYEAKKIIDALINHNPSIINKLGKKELAFLDFVKSNCVEPYVTMATNAIMWNDMIAYEDIKSRFPVIY